MSASNLNLLNAVTLISMGLWGYVETDSFTALIPVAFGVVFVLCLLVITFVVILVVVLVFRH